jgi:arylsulfatase A-like enzyme
VKNVLLIVVDCLRADRIDGPTSCRRPVIDGLAAGGARFTQALTTAPSTSPAFASLLTGCFQPRHGLHGLRGYRLGDVPTLPELLRPHGYHTVAEVTGPLLPSIGLDRGFVQYEYRSHRPAAQQEWWRSIGARLAALRPPWFALVHVWDLHRPRQVDRAFDTWSHGRTRYDRAVSTLDHRLPVLLGAMAPGDVVILTGDHGEAIEQFRGHAFLSHHGRTLLRAWRRSGVAAALSDRVLRYSHVGHGLHLHDELVRVPLLIRAPGRMSPGARADLASHVDVLPTVLDCLGLPVPAHLDGRSLRQPPEPDRAVFLQRYSGLGRRAQAIRTGAHKYIRFVDPPHEELLFDLASDPGERRNRARAFPTVLEDMRARLDRFLAASGPVSMMSAEEDAVLTKRLRELGYLD